MKVAIVFNPETQNVLTIRDYVGITEKGQVSHFIAELESIKSDLMEIWEEMNGREGEDEKET